MTTEFWLDAKHIYWRKMEGQKEYTVPGFTEIIKSYGLADNAFWTEAGRDEGTAIAQWMLFLFRGGVAVKQADPRIAGRVEAIKNFIRDTGFVFAGGETPLYSKTLRHGVMPDLWGFIGSFSWCIDGKRGAKSKTHKLQTAAQKLALLDNGFGAQKRGALYLKDDGTYKLDEHTDAGDEARWRSIAYGYHAAQFYKEN